ncbi:hypothetical protein M8818_005020 [Zalaria obscura]|uniref:Uncharacterized protein n=1 Tax=Zalaria obscura TaxID=2024903 RepID=A0ACC3SA57_9PEZI
MIALESEVFRIYGGFFGRRTIAKTADVVTAACHSLSSTTANSRSTAHRVNTYLPTACNFGGGVPTYALLFSFIARLGCTESDPSRSHVELI